MDCNDTASYHSFYCWHFPLVFEIHFVADKQGRDSVVAFHSNDLLFHCLYVLEGLVVGQAVADDEALAVLDVEISHGGLNSCSGRNSSHLAIGVLNGGIILLNKDALHELDCTADSKVEVRRIK